MQDQRGGDAFKENQHMLILLFIVVASFYSFADTFYTGFERI